MTVVIEHVLLYEGGHLVIGSQDGEAVLAVSSEDGSSSQSVRIPADELVRLAWDLIEEARHLGFKHQYLPAARTLIRAMSPEDEF